MRDRLRGSCWRQFKGRLIQLYEITRLRLNEFHAIWMIRAIESKPIQFIPGWIYLNDTEGGINLIRPIGYETYRATPTFRNTLICIFASDSARVSNIKLTFALYNFGQRYYRTPYSCNDLSIRTNFTCKISCFYSKTNLEIRSFRGRGGSLLVKLFLYIP